VNSVTLDFSGAIARFFSSAQDLTWRRSSERAFVRVFRLADDSPKVKSSGKESVIEASWGKWETKILKREGERTDPWGR
jgi:hypothetical protein